MFSDKYIFLPLSIVLIAFSSFIILNKEKKKPVFYIIGDSTVKNGDGKSSNLLQGWGSFISTYFDTARLGISNQAIGGRSSRTFITEGRWDKILATLQKGDYVIMQFGHNDSSPLDDTARARGTIKGTGEDSTEIYNPIRKQKEVVHTYGWYMRKYVNDAKAKGAIPIICSPIPRHDWKNGKVVRSGNTYTKWAKEVAEQTGAFFIDLHNIISDGFEEIGQEKATTFFPQDHTHTNKEGAIFNAGIVVSQLRQLKQCKLKKFLLK
jgi:rhamnogalacturonan acetylesterase